MDRQSFRRVLSDVRWTARQRQQIEEKLMQKVTDENGFLTKEASKLRPIGAADCTAWETEERDMKKHHIGKKFVWAGIAAAALLTAGTTAAVVASNMKRGPQKSEDSEAIEQSSRILEPEEMEENLLGLHLTDQTDSYHMTGWTFEQILPAPTETGWYHFSYHLNGMVYTDRETGQTVPLCAKPECAHDGNEGCVATSRYYNAGNPVYYDGYVYRLGYRMSDPENPGDSDYTQVLLRYEPDGSAVSEAAVFGQGESIGAPVIHRGYIWCVVEDNVYADMSIIQNQELRKWERLKDKVSWAIVGYEIATGETVTLYHSSDNNSDLPNNLHGDGDWLYMQGSGYDPKGMNRGCIRISLYSGKCETINYALNGGPWTDGGKMLYRDTAGLVGGTSRLQLKMYDVQTKETTLIQDDILYAALAFVKDTVIQIPATTKPDESICMELWDLSGNLLYTYRPEEHPEDGIERLTNEFAVIGDTIYFIATRSGGDAVYMCSLERMAAGDPDVQCAYISTGDLNDAS